MVQKVFHGDVDKGVLYMFVLSLSFTK